jgi:hypothetical protein
MAEPQAAAVVTTSTPEQASTTTSVPSKGSYQGGINSLLSEMAEEAESKGGDESAEGEPANDNADTDNTDAETEPKGEVPDEDLFSEASLSTKEGIAAARQKLQERDRKSRESYLGLKKYEKRLKGRHEKLQATVESYQADKAKQDRIIGNWISTAKGIESGDPDQMIEALGRISKMDGIQALELLNSRLINKGRSVLDPHIQAVIDEQQRQIQEMKQKLDGRDEETQLSRQAQVQEQQLQQHAETIAGLVEASPQFPLLQQSLQDDPDVTLRYLINSITSVNGQIDPEDVFAMAEAKINRALQKRDGGAGATRNKPTPGAPRSPGTSLGPRAAATSTRRQPTDEETQQQAVNDPNYWAAWGLRL